MKQFNSESLLIKKGKNMNCKEKKTILLVEDEAIVAMDDSIKLIEYGYNVTHVLTGQKAIEAVSDNKE